MAQHDGLRVKTERGDTVDVARGGPVDEYVTLRLENIDGPTWVLLSPAEALAIGDALKRVST